MQRGKYHEGGKEEYDVGKQDGRLVDQRQPLSRSGNWPGLNDRRKPPCENLGEGCRRQKQRLWGWKACQGPDKTLGWLGHGHGGNAM